MHFSLNEALRMVGGPEGSTKFFEHGTLQVKMYAPRGTDRQTPHRQDELYVIARGSGKFKTAGEDEVSFGPGDVLFAAAGVEHKFTNFTEDFATWVFFYGPDGGERA